MNTEKLANKVARNFESGMQYQISPYPNKMEKGIENTVEERETKIKEDIIELIKEQLDKNFDDLREGERLELMYRLPIEIRKQKTEEGIKPILYFKK